MNRAKVLHCRHVCDELMDGDYGSPEHRAVARQAVRESMVLLRNERNALPLKETAQRIHVAGRSANDIGIQSGGWTISWQGQAGNITTGGTTILAAIRAAVGRTTQVTYSADLTGGVGPMQLSWWLANNRTQK